MSRPPGSNFGTWLSNRPSMSELTRWKKIEHSAPTRLRITIQQMAILYPRAITQSVQDHALALCAIMYEQKLDQDTPQEDLRELIHRYLYGPLERKRRIDDDE